MSTRQEGDKSRKAVLVVSGIVIVVAGALTTVLIFSGDSPDSQSRQAADDSGYAAGDEIIVERMVDQQIIDLFDVDELHAVPEEVGVTEARTSDALRGVTIPRGSRRFSSVRELLPADDRGGFLHPRVSPDGLQIMVTRPGYQGIYVVPADGGEPELVAPVNAWGARWTDDGRIEVTGHDGVKRVYGTDGSLEKVATVRQEDLLAFGDDDRIFARTEPGAPAAPITPNNDRYINPILSPDGTHVAYLGLESGLYVARTDGSGEPIYLGMGNNPSWTADGSGVVFDVTLDDGHYLVTGDIFYASGDFSELSNLTEGYSHVGQLPSIGPDGRTVVFEAEGSIFEGTLN